MFRPLAEVEPWDWGETDEANRWWWSKGMVWRIDPSNHYALQGLMDDPLATAAAEQAMHN